LEFHEFALAVGVDKAISVRVLFEVGSGKAKIVLPWGVELELYIELVFI